MQGRHGHGRRVSCSRDLCQRQEQEPSAHSQAAVVARVDTDTPRSVGPMTRPAEQTATLGWHKTRNFRAGHGLAVIRTFYVDVKQPATPEWPSDHSLKHKVVHNGVRRLESLSTAHGSSLAPVPSPKLYRTASTRFAIQSNTLVHTLHGQRGVCLSVPLQNMKLFLTFNSL